MQKKRVKKVSTNQVNLLDQAKVALKAKQYEKVRELCRQAVHKLPKLAATSYQLWGLSYYNTNDFDKAESFFNKAYNLDKSVNNYYYLALAKMGLHKNDEAIEIYSNLIKLQPNNSVFYNAIAGIYNLRQQVQEAEFYCRKAIELDPKDAYAYKNLGTLLSKADKHEEAKQALEKAVALKPDFLDAWAQLGSVFERHNYYKEAANAFRHAQRWERLQQTLRLNGEWQEIDKIDQLTIETIKKNTFKVNPLSVLYIPQITRALHKLAGYQYAIRQYGITNQQIYQGTPQLNKKLKIGYLSADFFGHATMILLAGILEQHNTDKFDFCLYSYSPKSEDRYTERLAKLNYPLINVQDLSDQAVAEKIAADGVDILVDLKGYTDQARLSICERRPAPVIVSWLGFPGSLGHSRFADYIIGDAVVTPPEHAEDYSERLALMPHCYQPNDNTRQIGEKPTRAEVGLPENGFVFCSFNKVSKISVETFDLWCKILNQVENSVLWLLDPKNEQARENLKMELRKRGVDDARLIFAPFIKNHLERLQLADLALDTHPYNSHTTGSDALWAGVPLVAKIGDLFASRVGASLLTAHGVPELVVANDEEYVNLAVALATDKERYSQIRNKVEENRQHSALFNTAQFTQDLEALYEKIWQNHLQPQARVVS